MLEFVLGVAFFTGIAMTLVLAILLARSRLIPSGGVMVRINDKRSVQVPVGVKLLAALDSAGLHLPSACGGRGTCGQCKIRVVKGRSAATPVESSLLSRREISSGTRLACQLAIHGDLAIWVADEVYGVQRWRCRVRSSRCVGTLMKELTLELPPGESIDFRAGAFIQVTCPPFHIDFSDFEIDPHIHDEWDRLGLWALEVDCQEPQTRAYSLANHPQEKGIAMLIVRLAIPPAGAPPSVPPGCVSSYLFSLMPGDEVEIAGPFGHFFAPETQCEMIFVGGGAGMAPMRAHIFDQLKRLRSKRRISFWYGARNSRELFYDEDFAGLQQEHDNFEWYVALSEPGPGCNWQGDVGFIHQVLHDRYLADHPNPEECEYYLCGPPVMIKAMRSLLDELGVDPENIRYDDFGG
ncbi:NADH:ubiquinone reductase (Na(+)-transporting) subunit F [Pseudomonas sp. MMS21-TM103]|uniref:NADH:ubiquinone reductase (Na(+)-transporting) subunit F n=1 Tax=Pseudomonas sp. MMS21 TM103 TaxID=2886506 RepID=UPI001EDE95D3|nr:NADH:ubiquinone reductase (Na(+)-transporting) subunit F [Pseudomonas sp. MMS21 TM103]MCG4455974.1 NADH:ubiquinone reductase (Na(+)-transporting) subunit F [Pseudomonas sp. MMS21 TM103]